MAWPGAALVVLLALCGVLAHWRLMLRRAERERSGARRPAWSNPPALKARAAELDRELAGLGYALLGGLEAEAGGGASAVYLHPELPVYALLRPRPEREPELRLESFFENGGRLATTGTPPRGADIWRFAPGGARLLQLRALGPVTARALDGQHVGTLKAWIAGGRQPLPAGGEPLADYLEAEQHRLPAGGGSLGGYLRCFLFRRGVLRF